MGEDLTLSGVSLTPPDAKPVCIVLASDINALSEGRSEQMPVLRDGNVFDCCGCGGSAGELGLSKAPPATPWWRVATSIPREAASSSVVAGLLCPPYTPTGAAWDPATIILPTPATMSEDVLDLSPTGLEFGSAAEATSTQEGMAEPATDATPNLDFQ